MKTFEQKLFKGLVIATIIISVAAITIFVIALTKDEGGNTNTQNQYINVTAKALQDEYEKNVANADALYKDKLLQITGRVDEISSALFGEYNLKIKTVGDHSIVCQFSSSDDLKNLKADDIVVVRGICKGETIVVYIDDCILMK